MLKMQDSRGRTICLLCVILVLVGLTLLSLKQRNVQLRQPSFKNNTSEMDNYLTVDYLGRMGNVMFQYASLYGIAAKTNSTAYRPLSAMMGLNQFEPSIWMLPVRPSHKHKLTSVLESKFGTYDNTLYSRINKAFGPVRIGSYLQVWKYFKLVESQLRQTFIFRKSIMERVLHELSYMGQPHKKRRDNVSGYTTIFNQTIPLYNSKNNLTYITVHVRIGDRRGQNNSGIAPVSFIIKAMAYFRHAYQNVLFVFCSDGIDWCKNNFSNEIDVQFVMNLDASSTMALLSQCNHTIFTVGTFGWWSAWLAGGEVIYYSPSPSFLKERMLPQWIPIGD